MSWVPEPIVGPELIEELGVGLFQYSVTLQSPQQFDQNRLGERANEWQDEVTNLPAMIGIEMGAVLHERVTPEMTLESKTAKITLGGYFPQMDTSWRVIDEATGDVYDIVSIAHPVNAMTSCIAHKKDS